MTDRPPDLIKFLGTAGARFVVARQLRSSAGTFVRLSGKNIVLDPGPGTLVRLAKSKPAIDVAELDAIIVSHLHIDHSNDVNVLIDAMTSGGLSKRGLLYAPRECLEGEDYVVLKYLRGFLDKIAVLEPRRTYSFDGVSFTTSAPHDHGVETYGLSFDRGGQKISFLVDTRYFQGLLDSYAGSDLLIVNLVRLNPHESGAVLHLCVDDVRRILAAVRPRKAVLTHFGMTMIRAKPWVVAQQLGDELGIEVVAASDGMALHLD
ncbi:MAG: MBL fold metallo-hydrolase [Gemmatimonadota bacterium]|nr:MAG: MBL fold metallo-hydrolase [Gemmatimonadota bacterium]